MTAGWVLADAPVADGVSGGGQSRPQTPPGVEQVL